MKKKNLLILTMLLVGCAFAQEGDFEFRNKKADRFDSKGNKIETIETDRKISLQKGQSVSASEFRAKLAEDERLKKVAKACGQWFESVQQLEVDQESGEKDTKDNLQVSNDIVSPKTGKGILAYIQAMRVFRVRGDIGKSEGKDANQLKAALEELLYRKGGEVMVGPNHGVSIHYPLELLLVRYQSFKAQRTPVEDVKPAKSADLWPGMVPKDAQRVTKKVKLYPTGGILSTGLYAPPGEIITITAPSLNGNLTAQIGCHSDALDPQILALDETGKPDKELVVDLMAVKMGWQQVTDNRPLFRWPDCVKTFGIKKKRETIAFALGGPLYFRWGGGKRPMEIEVSGCVEMPYFRLGIDTNEDWVKEIRYRPAPWGEIETKNMILTIQSSHLRKVDNMEGLAQWWGKATALQYRLAGRKLVSSDHEADNLRPMDVQYRIDPTTGKMISNAVVDDAETVQRKINKAAKESGSRYTNEIVTVVKPKVESKSVKKISFENERKETQSRIVDDIQISAGAGHSGYPIMCIMWGGGMANLKGLQAVGSWGAMHELGHNMGNGRNGIYTLPGNGEVICNVYGCAVMNLINGTPLRKIISGCWNAVASKYAAGNLSWNTSEVFDRLIFYLTLADCFGWQVFIEAVNDDNEYPNTAIADRICCCFSRIVKRDLTPYFEMWKLPLSKNAYTFTGKWPPWPTPEEKEHLFGGQIDYRTGLPIEGDGVRTISNPEDVKPRRQLRGLLQNTIKQ